MEALLASMIVVATLAGWVWVLGLAIREAFSEDRPG